ncbi:CBS domain-containing protein [Streptomyces sp. SAI-135]|uniref:CBS domain-containing protein n=1 Tax=unclassified Streptomyces TaxID=2593676 RepID=UPI002472F6AC|nr:MULTISPECIES: CBS domain-containing protein [unclassified Streptomyces]MDH6515524.1 CBS domain-containing protein [Streptomyces sp. SAI-090]MDH6547737.1 CBS domain-containing protein [Streptomyces sp. SAI-041]MDH6566824.1 CBS domain-containing protein [Streptomyces sp. SAI-117]MDH6588237.1 CBS domain-containing protein [Streptomyces sp. SAI-133]MDH6620389.1 CBS domain-containing protein [Streptomyces sp. SAI-135]
MRARDLAVAYETVSVDSDAVDAARLMAEHKLPGLLVLDEQGEPKAILPASQMIKVLVPAYVIEDPALAAVVDEKHADRLCQALAGRRVGDCLSSKAAPPPIADPDDTALEVAALMAQVRSPLVAVAEKVRAEPGGREHGSIRLLGVITASHLLHELLGAAGTLRST